MGCSKPKHITTTKPITPQLKNDALCSYYVLIVLCFISSSLTGGNQPSFLFID